MSGPWIAAFVALCMVVLLVAFVVLGTLRRISTILEQAEERLRRGSSRIGGLEAGASTPDFEARTGDGETFTLSDLNGVPSILLFLSAGCQPCRALAAELAQDDRSQTIGAELFVVLNDPRELVDLGLPSSVQVIYQTRGAVSEAFQISGTPHAFVIRSGTVVASGIPNTLISLQNLADRLGEEVREESRAIS